MNANASVHVGERSVGIRVAFGDHLSHVYAVVSKQLVENFSVKSRAFGRVERGISLI